MIDRIIASYFANNNSEIGGDFQWITIKTKTIRTKTTKIKTISRTRTKTSRTTKTKRTITTIDNWNTKKQPSLRRLFLRYNTFDKKSLRRSHFGFSKNSLGGASSIIMPSSINSTLSATSLAKPIS